MTLISKPVPGHPPTAAIASPMTSWPVTELTDHGQHIDVAARGAEPAKHGRPLQIDPDQIRPQPAESRGKLRSVDENVPWDTGRCGHQNDPKPTVGRAALAAGINHPAGQR